MNILSAVESQLPPAFAGGLLLVSLMPVSMASLNRNDWLVDNSLKYSDLPSTSMFLDALRSAWRSNPQFRQWNVDPFRLFLWMYPQDEHLWEVYPGFT